MHINFDSKYVSTVEPRYTWCNTDTEEAIESVRIKRVVFFKSTNTLT